MTNDFNGLDAQADWCGFAQLDSCELEPCLEFESVREYQFSEEYKRDWIAGKIS